MHPTNARAYNSALMELGQSICRSGEPDCLLCPVRAWCRAEHPAELPVKLPKIAATRTEHNDILLLTEAGLLLERQGSGKRHEGMYRLPRRSADEVAELPLLTTQHYSVTRYKVTRRLYRAAGETAAREGECFIPLSELERIPMASPDRKLIDRYILKKVQKS